MALAVAWCGTHSCRRSVTRAGKTLAGSRPTDPLNDSEPTRTETKMTRQKVRTILGAVLAFACVANAGFAQTQATAINGTQASGGQDQSAAAMAQQASNPF